MVTAPVLAQTTSDLNAFGNGKWSFSNGPEFPGARGSFSQESVEGGATGKLNYRFSKQAGGRGGRYVEAIWTPKRPISFGPDDRLSFATQTNDAVSFRIRLLDQSGQTLQFDADESPSTLRGGRWKNETAFVGHRTSAHWGGANTGIASGKIVQIGIVANRASASPFEGSTLVCCMNIITSSSRLAQPDMRTASGIAEPAPSALEVMPPPSATQNKSGSAGDSSFRLSPDDTASGGNDALFKSRFGVVIHAVDPATLDVAKKIGASFIRLDMHWDAVEQHGAYDFSFDDNVLANLQARGLSALWILDYGHPDHGGKYTVKTDDDMRAYARFAAAAASHYKGRNVRFEIWNEEDAPRSTWEDPSRYAKLLSITLPAMRQADPNVVVSTGGTQRTNFPYLQTMLSSGTAKSANAIGVHPYRSTPPETILADMASLRRLIDRTAGQNVGIWATEWAYSSYEPGWSYGSGDSDSARLRQAVLGSRELLLCWLSNIDLFVWYDLKDDGTNVTNKINNYGLYSTAHGPKPVGKAVMFLSREASQRRLAGRINGTPSGIYAIKLTGSSGPVSIVWNTRSDKDYQLLLSESRVAGIYDMFGQKLDPAASGNNLAIKLTENAGPVYVEWR